MRVVKQYLKEQQSPCKRSHTHINDFLLSRRITPHSLTLETRSKRFLKIHGRIKLSCRNPRINYHIAQKYKDQCRSF